MRTLVLWSALGGFWTGIEWTVLNGTTAAVIFASIVTGFAVLLAAYQIGRRVTA